MAIWGIIGSNIFNSLWILWATWTLIPLKAYAWVAFDAYVNIAVVLIVLLFLYVWKKKLTMWRTEWWVLVALYFTYIGYLIYSL
jgi:Ca2+/Na+ antiporter